MTDGAEAREWLLAMIRGELPPETDAEREARLKSIGEDLSTNFQTLRGMCSQ